MQRVKKRSFQKFGNRMLPGGDLHEQEEKFFEFVTSRPESTVEEWIQLLSCSILRIDGTKPVEENVDFIYSESFDTSGCGFAVMNRLLKAAGHQVVKL